MNWTIFAIIGIAVLWLAFIYNKLVTLRNRADESWSDIDVQLKRRHNLIPNLVESVKGYASHEKGVLENVTKARAEAISAEKSGDPKKMQESENALSGTLKSLFAVSENYPDLKASQNFVELQRELRDTEDKIQASRRFYNTNIRNINIKVQSFPSNIVAKAFGFKKRDFFEIENPEEKEPVKVQF